MERSKITLGFPTNSSVPLLISSKFTFCQLCIWCVIDDGCQPLGRTWTFPSTTVDLSTIQISSPGENDYLGDSCTLEVLYLMRSLLSPHPAVLRIYLTNLQEFFYLELATFCSSHVVSFLYLWNEENEALVLSAYFYRLIVQLIWCGRLGHIQWSIFYY